MSTIVVPPTTASAATIPVAKTVKSWLVSPWFDLFFIANLAWPIAALIALWRPLDDSNPASFFQMYFLSTPHRWITLVLVFCDSDRFWKEPAKFGGVTLGLILLGLALVAVAGFVPFATHSLLLLMMLDYIWNAWHFAAQHAGISRIYGRITRPEQTEAHVDFERSALRSLVLWVFFRFAVHMATRTEYSSAVESLTPWLPWFDPFALILPVILLVREAAVFRPQTLGRVCYIGSVIAIYSAQLFAINRENTTWMVAFFFAGAIFHAVEYLAICNWSVQKRTTGIWHYQVTRTGLALFVFMAVFGAANYLVNAQSVYAWQLITLLVSLLHYGFDGMIWKAKPAPAKPA